MVQGFFMAKTNTTKKKRTTTKKKPTKKAQRQQAHARRMSRVILKAWARLEAMRMQAQLVADADLGKRVRELSQANLDAIWKSQDGSQLRVQAMSMAHLCFALAKGFRGEYAANSYASDKHGALKSELLRRLIGVAGTERQQAAHNRDALRAAAKVPNFAARLIGDHFSWEPR